MNTHQIAIVGGGLVGLTSSIELALNGFDVVLFEKEQYPYHKVCGEYVSLESFDYLNRLGINLTQLNLPIIKRLKVSAPNGNSLAHDLPLGGFGISRFALDNLLYQRALDVGVNVITGCKVLQVENHSLTTTHGLFNAQLVLGTWGKRSNLDVKLNRSFISSTKRSLSNYIGVKYHVVADLPDDIIELHNFKDGYCGISRIEDDKYCMCYLTTGDNLKENHGDIRLMEKMVLYKNPYLSHYFQNFKPLYDEPLAISQISFEGKSIAQNGIIMAGDTAGLITPLCGNGMSMAMHAAHLLSQTIIKNGMDETKIITDYGKQWKATFESRLKTGKFIQSVFGHPTITNVVISMLKPFPFLVNRLIKQTHGKPF